MYPRRSGWIVIGVIVHVVATRQVKEWEQTSPEEICRLFQMYMAEGNLELLLSIYDAEAVF